MEHFANNNIIKNRYNFFIYLCYCNDAIKKIISQRARDQLSSPYPSLYTDVIKTITSNNLIVLFGAI